MYRFMKVMTENYLEKLINILSNCSSTNTNQQHLVQSYCSKKKNHKKLRFTTIVEAQILVIFFIN